MTRIQFSTAGVVVNYTLILNPVAVVLPSSESSGIKHSQEVLEGEPILFTEYFDSRRHALIWQRIPAEGTTLATNFAAQLTTLEGYVGSKRYIRMNEIGDALGVFDSWTYIKVLSVDKTLSPGGRLIYDRVEFIFELADT